MATYDDCELCHKKGKCDLVSSVNSVIVKTDRVDCPLCAMRARAEQAEAELEHSKFLCAGWRRLARPWWQPRRADEESGK